MSFRCSQVCPFVATIPVSSQLRDREETWGSSIGRTCEHMRSHAQTLDPLARGFLSLGRWEFSPATAQRAAALPSKSTRSLSAYDAGKVTAQRLAQRQPPWGIAERHFRCSAGLDRSVPVRSVAAENALSRISASAGPTEMPPASHSVYCGSAQRRRQPTKPPSRAPPEPYSDAAGRVVAVVRCVQLAARRVISGHQTSVSPPRPSGAGWIWFAGSRDSRSTPASACAVVRTGLSAHTPLDATHHMRKRRFGDFARSP